MHSSYDEIRRLANRALDAGGAAAGIDEDSAHAVAWLEAAGLPGLAVLADALDGSDAEGRAAGLGSSGISPSEAEIDAGGRSAVFFAASVIDLLIALAGGPNDAGFVRLRSARHPLVLAASAARFCPPGKVITFGWNDAEFRASAGQAILCTSSGTGSWSDPDLVDVNLICGPATLACVPAGGCSLSERIVRALRDGLTVDDEAFARVVDYAARILVPESDASRETGAGAGLTDND